MIPVHSRSDIDRVRAACLIVYQAQQALREAIGPGVTTLELDALAEGTIRAAGAIPAFKGFGGFPATICASVNAEAIHGFPRREPLRPGDVLSVDVGVELDGFFGDAAFTVAVGEVPAAVEGLLVTTAAALDDAIAAARPGGRLSDISHAVESRALAGGLSVVREYGGHGIGRALHGEPHIPNHGRPGRGPVLRPGFVLAIEPILSLGQPEVEVADDGWTVLTVDRSPVAHFEHTIAITEAGPEILTLPAGMPLASAPPARPCA
ncbi:MAG: type I methionyl aminopeptidase [Gemmatimonadota bacterium]